MGINVDFLIKHIRPYGMQAWEAICNPTGPGSLSAWLLASGVSQADISAAFNAWAQLAFIPINDQTMPQFIAGANLISQARWTELYPGNRSTILFLTQPLLSDLSLESSRNAHQTFDFRGAEDIPLAITINHLNQPPQTFLNAYGAKLAADRNGNCSHFIQINQGAPTMSSTTALSSESVRRMKRSASFADKTLQNAGTQARTQRIQQFFGIEPTLTDTATTPPGNGTMPPQGAINTLLSNSGSAPGASTIVTVPSAPASGDLALVDNVLTLDSYISVLTAIYMYNNHPAPYDLSVPAQAGQFVTDLANARNFIVTGGQVQSLPMYLPMGEATSLSFNKATTSANLHIDLLTALFAGLSLPAAELTELDSILTEIASSLKSLQLSFTTQTQTLNHFHSFYYLTPVPGSNPPINQMNVEFIYLQLAQSSWEASLNKSSVSNFTLTMTTTTTTATMNNGIVSANYSDILSALSSATAKDPSEIADMTGMKGIQTTSS